MLLLRRWPLILSPMRKVGALGAGILAAPLAAALWCGIAVTLTGCVSTPAYVLCNEQGNETGCADPVEISVSNEE